jgi:hypothetical protein
MPTAMQPTLAHVVSSCIDADACFPLTILPPRVPLILSEEQLPVVLQRRQCFLECLLHNLQSPYQIYNKHG